MRVVVLHNAVTAGAGPDEEDVLVQVQAVSRALEVMGHEPQPMACTLDLASIKRQLAQHRPDVVFNLVEALDGSEQLIHLVPALLAVTGLPSTGSPAESLFLSTHKLLAKERLAAAGLPTPAWQSLSNGQSTKELAPPYIVKAVWEHGSFGLGDEAVTLSKADAPGGVARRLAEVRSRWARPCFAEQYIEGREFNVSLLGGSESAEILPAAEIVYHGFPDHKPRILGFQAKWDIDSFEYRHTVRRFTRAAADGPLLDRLAGLARDCWSLFGLRGYARADFRVDHEGRPWILEVNANPCLSPDAGLAAALLEAGIPYERAIERILADAMKG